MKSTKAPKITISILVLSCLIVAIVQEIPNVQGAGYINPIPTGIVVPAPTFFHSYDTVVSELIQLNSSYPDLVTIQIIGYSVQNRSIVALRITENPHATENILYMGLHHADEWMSMEVVMYLIHYYLANAHHYPRIDAILQKANVWFIPLVNPDGLVNSETHDSLWRKNRRDNGDGTFGVDLNRNYGYQWNTGNLPGSLTSTSSIEYPGPEPFSEPETQAIRAFATAHPPVFSVSYHTAGQWILWPWSYTPNPSADDGLFRAYAEEMAATNGYQLLQEGHSTHNKPGNADDWLYSSFGTLAFTFEVGPAFSSQDVQHIQSIVLDNVEAAVHGAELSLHIVGLSCQPKALLCVPALSVISVGIPLMAGVAFFGVRIKHRRNNKFKVN